MESTDPAAEPELAPGAVVAGFVIERTLGRGASGVVYAALRAGEPVALKVLSRAGFEDPDAVARFGRESRAIQRIEHPAIARVLSAGTLADGRAYLVTERVGGGSLREALDARGAMAPSRAWAIVRAVGDGLAAAHAAGVVHRDVKPDNVMLTEDGRARLVDFGLARIDAPGEATWTGAGVPLGTPAYMPPEQWWNDGVGPAADQYALAATLYELCAGTAIFKGDSFVSLMQSHLSDPPPTFAAAGLSLPASAEAWLARALAKSPAARFESMAALVRAGDEAFGAAPVSASVRAPTPSWRALAALSLSSASLVAVGYAGSRDPRAWAHVGGMGTSLSMAVFALLACASVLRAGALPLWVELVPAALGSLGAYSGLFAVFAHAPRFGPARHFEVFNLGLSEAQANRFVGLGASVSLLLAGLWRTRVPSLDGRLRRDLVAASSALALLAAAGLAAAAPSAVYVALAATCALSLVGGAQGSPSLDAVRAVRALAAVLAAASLGLTRADARAAVAWSEAPSRAARARELCAALGEARATAAAAALAVALAVYVALRHLRRSDGRWGWVPRSRRAAAAGAALAVYVALEAAAGQAVAGHRAALWRELSGRFALFARLDPPTMGARTLPLPTVGVSVQLAQTTLGVDGEAVGLVRALEGGADARRVLAVDLSHALGRSAEPEVVVMMIDRRARWSAVHAALSAAEGVGARRVELLLTRGPSPTVGPGDPSEASYALPRDFGAVVCALSTTAGARFDGARSAGEVLPSLAEGGACALLVGP